MDRLTVFTSPLGLEATILGFRTLDLAEELEMLLQELTRRNDGYCAKTLSTDPGVSSVLFAIKAGIRIPGELIPPGVSIHVLAGYLELHVGEHCGDEWDMLPYLLRNTEGAVSFFALDDHTIDLPAGSEVALDPAAPHHDIEAVDDSAFIVEVRST